MQNRILNRLYTKALTFLPIAIAMLSLPAVFADNGSSSSQTSVSKPAHDDDTSRMVLRLLSRPNRENFTALQDHIAAGRSYDQTARGLAEMVELCQQKRYPEALAKFKACLPDQMLSPKAHFCAARCYEALGQKDQQKAEAELAHACLQGLAATGNGSAESPFRVTHVTDEYDLLAWPLQTESKSQSLTHKKGRWYDVLECTNGKTYWFDVTLMFGRGNSGGKSALASTPKPAASRSLARKRVPAEGTYASRSLTPKRVPAERTNAADSADRSNVLVAGGRISPSRQEGPTKTDWKVQPAHPATPPPEAFAAYDRGMAAIHRRDFDRAIEEFGSVLELDPKSADAYYARGFACIEKHDPLSAYADLSNAIRLRPGFAAAYCERGIALCQEDDKERLDAAIADFSAAIRLAPHDAAAYTYRSRAFASNGDLEHAQADAEKAASLKAMSREQ